ncbi:glycosyltransferase [Frankia sp. Cas3]|uniref:glycosyltransferase n=1 Tax=Frankia sp. Cas3 TaxID=3073926 RepID=UPI002AD2A6D4|nr:glycosyltransferase [Frankia sp. Cas3]
MRVLFTTVPLHGHFFPMVPLAHALGAAGHEVLVATPASFTDVVTDAGLPTARSAPPLNFSEIMTVDRNGKKIAPARTAGERQEAAGRAWGRLTARTLDRTLELADRWRPDMIISEPGEHAGSLAAEIRGVPWIEHGWGVSTMPEARSPAREELAPELAHLGLPDLPEPDLHLHPCPPGLQRPQAPGSRNQHMRYIPYSGTAVLSDWILRKQDRPQVCLALGSHLARAGFRDFTAMLAEVAAALPSLGVDLVVGLEDTIESGWTPLPAGVHSAGWLPLGLVAPSCDLIIHHGRSGSMLTAVAAGLPQLALPQAADQFENATCITDFGAGRQLVGDNVTAELIVEACREMLGNPSYRDRAAVLTAENAAQPTPADVVSVLCTLIPALV